MHCAPIVLKKHSASFAVPAALCRDEVKLEERGVTCPKNIPLSLKWFAIVTAIAVYTLIQCYMRAAADMALNPDWSISRIIAYPYNAATANGILLPALCIMVVLYMEHFSDKGHVWDGGVCALVGFPVVFFFNIIDHTLLHGSSLTFFVLASWKWKRDLTPGQSICAVTGLIVALAGKGLLAWKPFWVFGAMLGLGEVLILSAWATMILNE